MYWTLWSNKPALPGKYIWLSGQNIGRFYITPHQPQLYDFRYLVLGQMMYGVFMGDSLPQLVQKFERGTGFSTYDIGYWTEFIEPETPNENLGVQLKLAA